MRRLSLKYDKGVRTMGSLISYSGISTKVKAMERFRIRPEQFEAMADLICA